MNDDDPLSSELESIRRFYDGEYYREVPSRIVASAHHRRLAQRLGVQQNMAVLDVACGTGAWLSACAARGAAISGVDLSTRAIAFCQAALPSGEFMATSAEQLPFTNAHFDLITCLGSLEHFVDPLQALTEMRRVAKSQSRIVILVPNADFLTRRLGFFGGTYQTQAKEQVLTLSAWAELFDAAGLKVEHCWKDLHVLSRAWIVRKPWPLVPARLLQACALALWPLRWQYQVYFLCTTRGL